MTQHEEILEILRRRGDKGASNFELMRISYQYPARIHTLRHRLGHDIDVKHVHDKEWVIKLVKDAEPLPEPTPPIRATEVEQTLLFSVPPAHQRRMMP